MDVYRDDPDDPLSGVMWALDVRLTLYECDETGETLSQFWFFNPTTQELVSVGSKGYDSSDVNSTLCAGWGTDESTRLISDGRALRLRPCDGRYKFDKSFFVDGPLDLVDPTSPVHGSFYFDAYRNINTRGYVQPQNVHQLSASKELYKTISSDPAGT